ncbi:hypothetical protein N656DRAFT_747311 [Canariomyces notabilis]|uniref:Ubiquitin-like domain-containing protein n=1 Tax=Canariomyces notabilis TaxID=2074819 RepID=A0AAN6YVS1_9PEZI|nr:hypothetical protein N656DRAFT_747311 [Canariomyces arenarius]
MSSSSRRLNGGGASSSSSPTRPPRSDKPFPPTPRIAPAPVFPPTPPPLHITIRFSTSLPDLHLDIPSPHETTVIALKHLIRGRLALLDDTTTTSAHKDQAADPTHPSRARLRFIHNGRILPDACVLSAVLKAPPPPPLSQHAHEHPERVDRKGKAPVGAPPQQQRVFINCSIGDSLSEEELAEEEIAASAPPPTITTTTSSSANSVLPSPLSTPTPRNGFDRLLQAGLSPPEISVLRAQFRRIHTARYTPEDMPSPDTLRRMEDAWLDSNSNTSTYPTTTTTTTGTTTEDWAGGEDPVTEDVYGLSAVAGPLIRGMLMGFVFPLGVIAWAGKEEGLWSRRMQVFVVFGVLLSVSVGVVRGLTGEG